MYLLPQQKWALTKKATEHYTSLHRDLQPLFKIGFVAASGWRAGCRVDAVAVGSDNLLSLSTQAVITGIENIFRLHRNRFQLEDLLAANFTADRAKHCFGITLFRS